MVRENVSPQLPSRPDNHVIDSLLWYPTSPSSVNEDRKLLEEMKETRGFKTPMRFKDVTAEVLDMCAGVFVPGGHAPMQDLGDDAELGRVLTHFHGALKPVCSPLP